MWSKAPVVFEVTLYDPPVGRAVTVDYAAIPLANSASTADFVPTSGTVTFAPGGPATQTVAVSVIPDNALEAGDEYFRLSLTNPVNTMLARANAYGNIIDDDRAFVRVGDAIVVEPDEGTVDVAFNFTRTGATSGTTTVSYAAARSPFASPATDEDFQRTTGSLVFGPGETVKTITLDGDSNGAVVASSGGGRLDGECANGYDAYPSGGAPTAGADFRFRVNLLAGDSSQDGTVNALDLAYVKQRLNRSIATPGPYTFFADVTADGRINALDLAAVRQRRNARLPIGDPAPLPVGIVPFSEKRVDPAADLRALLASLAETCGRT